MTAVGLLSVKGAPGVTTVSCLLATTWPGGGRSLVVEADPSGGSLAARFGLRGAQGVSSFVAAARRGGASASVDSHLQELPGGLAVLAAPPAPGRGSVPREVMGAVVAAAEDGVAVVDLGRWLPDHPDQEAWLRACDGCVVLLRGDAADAVVAREVAARLDQVTVRPAGVVVVGGGRHACAEVASFTGLVALGELPCDPTAAAVAAGSSGAVRRLQRSSLLAAGRQLAERLSGWVGTDIAVPQVGVPTPVPATGLRAGAR